MKTSEELHQTLDQCAKELDHLLARNEALLVMLDHQHDILTAKMNGASDEDIKALNDAFYKVCEAHCQDREKLEQLTQQLAKAHKDGKWPPPLNQFLER